MFVAQTLLFGIIGAALSSDRNQPANSNRQPGGKDGRGNEPGADPRGRLLAALAEMLPSTRDELSQVTALAPATVESYLTEMSGRCIVMFNPLTKRYSLPKTAPNGTLAA